MTTISAVSSTASAAAYQPARRQDPMAKVADALGLSSNDLKTRPKSGKSLDDVATAQGVSHDDLIAAIKSGIPSDGTDSTETAEKIARSTGVAQVVPRVCIAGVRSMAGKVAKGRE